VGRRGGKKELFFIKAFILKVKYQFLWHDKLAEGLKLQTELFEEA